MIGAYIVVAVMLLPNVMTLGETENSEPLWDEWIHEDENDNLQQGRESKGQAVPTHHDEDDFMNAFFANQDHSEFADNQDEIDSNDLALEEHFDSFFQQDEAESDEKYEDFLEEAIAEKDSFDDSLPPTFEVLDDDDDDDDDTVLTENFFEFPEDDLFANVQDTGDEECEDWKKQVSDAQNNLIEEGKALGALMKEASERMKRYKEQEKVKCTANCHSVCIPALAGEVCLEEKNGTCVAREPRIEECQKKIADPDCTAKERECDAKKEKLAQEVGEVKMLMEKEHNKIMPLENALKEATSSIPEKCKTMMINFS